MSNYAWREQTRVIGIDPGQTGALVLLVEGTPAEVHDMPTVPGGKMVSAYLLNDLIWRLYRPGDRVVIEKVHSMPKDGHQAAFKFGQNLGLLCGVLTARGIPYLTVSPQKWKRDAGLIRKPKKASVVLAKNRWPEQAHMFKKHGQADAALIGWFG